MYFAGICLSCSGRNTFNSCYFYSFRPMSAKKSRRVKGVVPNPRKEKKQMGSPDLSSINRTSFMEGLQQNFGNPLHSTALEEDLNVPVDREVGKGPAGSRAILETLKTTGKQHRAAVKRTGNEEEEEEEEEMIRRRSKRVRNKSRSSERTAGKRAGENGSEQSCVPQNNIRPAASTISRLARGKVTRGTRGRGRGQVSAASGQLKDKRTETDPRDKTSAESEEETDSGAVQQRRRKVLSSDEGTDEDTSWNPSPKMAKAPSFGPAARSRKSQSKGSKSRKSSSVKRNYTDDEDVSSGGDGASCSDTERRRRRPVGWGGAHFEVILDAFLDFCDQYRESVQSAAVNQTVTSFSRNIEEQLLEKISSLKGLQTLKKENTKLASLIRTKTRRLLDAKSELMRAERQLWLLQKEEAELQQRLADIEQGQSFLHGIRELSRKYLGHRLKHRTQKETYGASSLPALLLETRLCRQQLGGNH